MGVCEDHGRIASSRATVWVFWTFTLVAVGLALAAQVHTEWQQQRIGKELHPERDLLTRSFDALSWWSLVDHHHPTRVWSTEAGTVQLVLEPGWSFRLSRDRPQLSLEGRWTVDADRIVLRTRRTSAVAEITRTDLVGDRLPDAVRALLN